MDKKTFRLNQLFNEQFNTMGNTKSDDSVIATSPKAPKNVGKKKPPIVQHTKFTDDNMSESDFSALKRKSDQSGLPLNILGEVFDRGIDSWTESTNLSPQQFAFNRVNSFIKEGRAYREDDADLAEAVRTFGKRGTFKNINIDIRPGQKAKVTSGDHAGKRGVVLGKSDRPDGPVYRIQHDDGTVLKHHYSTVDSLENERPVRRVSEEVEILDELSKNTLQSYLKKKKDPNNGKDYPNPLAFRKAVLSQGTAEGKLGKQYKRRPDPAPVKVMATGVKRPLSEEGLWDNIHAKRKRIENGSNETMRKPGSKGAPTAQALKAAQESVDLDESNNKPHVKPHYGDPSRPQKQTAWKASNKHGKVKYFGLDFKSAAVKHAGIVNEASEMFDEDRYDEVMEKFGGKMWHTSPKHPGDAVSGWVAMHDPKKAKHVILRVDTATGIRKSGASEPVDHSVHEDHLVDSYEKSKAAGLSEGRMAELDYDMKNLDNGNFKKKYGKQKEVVRSNLSNKTVTQEERDNPINREQGTDSLVNIYKQSTPGQSGDINSAFATVFREEVVSADRKPLIVRPFKKEITDPQTGERKLVDVKGHAKTTPARRTIIKSGNISDGKPNV